jgi:hypothetical protein
MAIQPHFGRGETLPRSGGLIGVGVFFLVLGAGAVTRELVVFLISMGHPFVMTLSESVCRDREAGPPSAGRYAQTQDLRVARRCPPA